MKRPLATAVCFYIAGVFSGYYGHIFLFAVLWAFAAFALTKFFRVHLGFFVMFFGFAAFGLYNIHTHTQIEKPSEKPITYKGYIKDSAPSAGKYIVQADVGYLVYNEQEFKLGDIVEVTGVARLLQVQRNFGGFNEQRYYAARDVYYKMYSPEIRKVGAKRFYIPRLREYLCKAYDDTLPPREAGVMKALVAGERANLDDDLERLYSVGGIYHILSISGLHIVIVILALTALLTNFFSMKKSQLIALLFLLGYMVLTGCVPSVVRSVIMFAVAAAAFFCNRTYDGVTGLCVSAFLILLNPFYLWDAGFLFSFSAVAGIILIFPKINRLLAGCPKGIRESLGISISVCISTFPVCTDFLPFHSMYTILVNIILFPTFTFLLAGGFVLGIVGMIAPFSFVATTVAAAVYTILKFYEVFLEVVTKFPFSWVLLGYIPLGVAAVYYLAVVLFLRNHRFAKIAFGAFCAAFSFNLLYVPFSVTMLDVGQGDCFVIRSSGKTMVIDGGGNILNPEIKTGKRVLLPYLNYLAVRRVDYAVITHTDYDHYGGIVELLLNKKVGKLYLPAVVDTESEDFKIIMDAAKKSGTEVGFLERGDKFTLGKARLMCLAPDTKEYYEDVNDTSAVLKLSYKNASFLFTGDITQTVEKILIKEYNLGTDVLKIPHHGSKYSNSTEFLQAAHPKIGIVSYAEHNVYNFIPPETRKRLENIVLFETAKHGAVRIGVYRDGLRVKTAIKYGRKGT
ncbi:DNA internalization-related competence protein ComEC/Rec2 [Clostridia bacterium]|nr:DNA internalization-related competence protein ComEC/Rec2 [Clostridia bacterium]